MDGTFRETAVEVPVTARRVVTDGATTLAMWVADQEWGSCSECVRQEMVDALADRFLRPGASNDIHDWVTAIFGAPWGPHNNGTSFIPEEYVDEIHIVIYDVEGAGGHASLGDTRLRNPDSSHIDVRHSHERLLFVLDAPSIARARGPSWEVTDPSPAFMVSALAHEFWVPTLLATTAVQHCSRRSSKATCPGSRQSRLP